MSLSAINIVDACLDPALFGRWFLKPETWRFWFMAMRAVFGLAMSEEELALFEQYTGRKEPPAGGVKESWFVVGRRGGKSLILSVIAVYLAGFLDWTPYLTPG